MPLPTWMFRRLLDDHKVSRWCRCSARQRGAPFGGTVNTMEFVGRCRSVVGTSPSAQRNSPIMSPAGARRCRA
jgi:hypothetical protein